MEGKEVKWLAVNGIVSGVIEGPACQKGDWLVKLPSGKVVIVNEKSFIDG